MNKKTLSETDICDKFIRPAIEAAGWDGMLQIYREYPLRAGRVVMRGRKARRDASTVLRADYALFYKTNILLAVIEAKDNHHAVGEPFLAQVRVAENRVKLPKLNQEALNGFWVPVPPRAEQPRIVARVNQLRRHCADLRQRLAASQTTQSRLANSLIVSSLAS